MRLLDPIHRPKLLTRSLNLGLTLLFSPFFTILFSLFLGLGLSSYSWSQKPDAVKKNGSDPEVIQVTIDLTDGSRVTGTCATKMIRIQNLAGEMNCDLTNVKSIKHKSGKRVYEVSFSQNDLFTGVITLPDLTVKTAYGSFVIDRAKIIRLAKGDPSSISRMELGFNRTDAKEYRVRAGDKLRRIARIKGTTVEILRALNDLKEDEEPKEGEKILIPPQKNRIQNDDPFAFDGEIDLDELNFE